MSVYEKLVWDAAQRYLEARSGRNPAAAICAQEALQELVAEMRQDARREAA